MAIFCNRMVNRVVDSHNDSTCEITRATWLTTPVYQFGKIYTARTSSEKHFPKGGTFICSSSPIRWKNVNN